MKQTLIDPFLRGFFGSLRLHLAFFQALRAVAVAFIRDSPDDIVIRSPVQPGRRAW